jgi:hypothetical protein
LMVKVYERYTTSVSLIQLAVHGKQDKTIDLDRWVSTPKFSMS